jgi:hypothetical protein
MRVFANQHFARYNTRLTTKRAGTNRPFFLVERFWSSKLSEGSPGVIGFFVLDLRNMEAREVLLWVCLAACPDLRGLYCFSGIELNTWHCSKSLNKL